ncbi:MAG: DUF547 domain-containing protein [Flavobacteriales bacterium]
MRSYLFFLSFFLALYALPVSTTAQRYSAWDSLLGHYVTNKGFVDYKELKKKEGLMEEVLAEFRDQYPGPEASSPKEVAYWINAYNAYAIDLVLEHYPIESIRDIDRAFEKKFIELGDKRFSLDGIEKGIILKENEDPRLHYAVNCASISCPPLRDEAYKGGRLDRQLKDQALDFINDPEKNRLKKERVRISKIYDWYRKDFTRNGSLIDHLNRYAKGVRIAPGAEVKYMEYDWGLNEKR